MSALALVAHLLGAVPPAEAAPAPAPDFGPNVLIFDPSMTNIQEQIDAVFKKMERNQFGAERYAYLFKPGHYNLDVQVGFYMQVAGLGASPDDVDITGAVRSKAGWMRGNATCNFWRSAENFAVTPTQDNNVNVWAVSQATALRRVHIKGPLNLSDNGWSSGGFMVDSKVDGTVNAGTQQQWISRNDEWASWVKGDWNIVFVGSVNAPTDPWPGRPYSLIEKTPLVREKPFLTIDKAGRYSVFVPDLKTDSVGVSWAGGAAAGKAIPFEQFYLAHAGQDTAATLNAALAAGQNLIFTPGLYRLDAPVKVTRAETIVFGLGYATLRPEQGTPALVISDVDGVLVCGLLIEASGVNSTTLVEVGDKVNTTSHARNPVCLFDLFCRAGGAVNGTCDCMVTLNANDVVGDNFWLWRADHGAGAGWNSNKNPTGLIVNGANVLLYGLFVEHQQAYQTVWNGNGGRCYFYQSELPYDPPNQDAWKHGPVNGYASYKVADTVTTHEAWGLGIYSVLRRPNINNDRAIETPAAPGIKMRHMVTARFAGPGVSQNVINGQKGITTPNGQGQRVEQEPAIEQKGTTEQKEKVGWVTGYWSGWARIAPKDVAWNAFTHMCIFSATPTASGGCNLAMGWNERRVQAAVAAGHSNQVKVLLCVGGAGTGKGFVASTADAASRATFIKNIIALMRQYEFDGVDMDWEELDGKQDQYVALHKELRAELDQISPRPLLTVAIANWMFSKTAAGIHPYMDQMNNMSYWTRIINNGVVDEAAIAKDMQGLIDKGVPKAKLGVGIGLDYEEGHAEVDCDPAACAAKSRFAISQEFGGVMIWAIEKDVKKNAGQQPCHVAVSAFTPSAGRTAMAAEKKESQKRDAEKKSSGKQE